MKNQWIWSVVLCVGVAITTVVPSVFAAGNFCGNSLPCDNGTCVSCNYTYYYRCPAYAGGPLIQCTGVTQTTCCHITGQFPCTYCDNTGTCYYSCPGGGGGGGGGGPAPTSPPPPTSTPALPATLQAVAIQVTPVDTSCTAVHNAYLAGTGVSGTIFGFTVNPPVPQTQSGATLLTFSNVTPGTYTLTATPPSVNWMVSSPCQYKNGTLVGLGYSAVANGGDTVKWEIGYTKGTAWVQTAGGDVYASGRLGSYIPAVSPRVFNDVGAGGYPGVVTYGTSYDFDSDPYAQGRTLVSSKNWLAQATRTTVNYYDLFYHRFGAPTATDNALFPSLLLVTQPASRSTPYYITGDMTTAGDWSVGSGQNIVFLVNGNLTIGGKINIVPNSTGFVSFIVNGTITVDSTVGTTSSSTTPVVEGIYIATKADQTGAFDTNYSTAASTARFVGKGMFVADTFLINAR